MRFSSEPYLAEIRSLCKRYGVSRQLLEDIRDATAFVSEITRDKTFDDYRRDRLLRHATERNFEIIGEAMSRLAKHDPQTAAGISKHRRITEFRNLIIHGYDLIDQSSRLEHHR